jgi:sec-independent protein translocase protein TatA
MFKNLGVTEILIILVVVIVLFGSKKIPDLARSLGKSINEFKRGRRESLDEPAPEDTDTTRKA